ncbi:MAG: cytochrome c family protein [Gammaproteobacteria bacterium]|nr:cytochrome c family protein [Gammaproteobacteria bacterium]
MKLARTVSIPRNCLYALLGLAALAAVDHAIAAAAWETVSNRLATAEASRGEKLFLQCRACHVSKPNVDHTVGPNLWGIVGQPVGSQAGYAYSDGLKTLGGRWDYERLSQYLHDPKSLVPDTRMIFAGIARAQDRADLLAYLRTLSDDPVALPRPLSLPVVQSGSGQSEEKGARQASDWQGLPPGPGREEVFYSCNTCHSLMLVKQQGLSRGGWDETLEWMVEEQGMTEIEDIATRNLILDYLSTHFGVE